MSFAIELDIAGIDLVDRRLLSLGREDFNNALESVGALVESQTRRRIQEEKQSPEGDRWQEWSDSYARTRHGGHSLLQGEGDLLDSLQYQITGDDLEVGSNLVYAATQQEGDERLAWGKVEVTIPARPFLGLSDQDAEEVVSLLDNYIDDVIGGRR